MITLQSIEIEGFGSVITPIKYKINRIGLNKIEGKNGAGKTTITNALSWVAWGQLVKPRKSSVSPWPHVIDENYHGTRVLLKFHDEKDKYKIIRCNEYTGKILGKTGKNRLIILKNNKEITDKGLRNKADYQKWIINKLGYTFDLFKSTVLFTQELDNIMKEDGPSRKKIFDEAFETTFVNNAKKRVEERLVVKEKDYGEISHKIELNKEKLRGVRNEIKIMQEVLENYELDKETRINKLHDELEKLKAGLIDAVYNETELLKLDNKLVSLNKVIKKYEDFSNREFKREMSINGAEEELMGLKLTIEGLKDRFISMERKCPECGRPLDKEKIIQFKEKIRKEINSNKSKIKEIEDKIYTLKKDYKVIKKGLIKFSKIKDKIEKIKVPLRELPKVKFSIENLKERISNIERNIKNLENEKPRENKLPQLINQRDKLKSDLSYWLNEKKSIKKEITTDKWLIKDPLSNSGLKAFIFDTMLARVNNYLSEYKNIIGFGIKVFVDMISANKDIRILIERNGDEVPYEDLSKGQKQLVHVVLAFALSDTVQAIKPINAIFLDELFENLSVDNIEIVGRIIEAKSKNKSIHLITHQSSFSPANCNTTYVELNHKFQTMLF